MKMLALASAALVAYFMYQKRNAANRNLAMDSGDMGSDAMDYSHRNSHHYMGSSSGDRNSSGGGGHNSYAGSDTGMLE